MSSLSISRTSGFVRGLFLALGLLALLSPAAQATSTPVVVVKGTYKITGFTLVTNGKSKTFPLTGAIKSYSLGLTSTGLTTFSPANVAYFIRLAGINTTTLRMKNKSAQTATYSAGFIGGGSYQAHLLSNFNGTVSTSIDGVAGTMQFSSNFTGLSKASTTGNYTFALNVTLSR